MIPSAICALFLLAALVPGAVAWAIYGLGCLGLGFYAGYQYRRSRAR